MHPADEKALADRITALQPTLPAVTRDEACQRAVTVWPMGGVTYDQGTLHTDGYRTDCSGFVSDCWKVPVDGPGSWGGFNTASMVEQGYAVQLPHGDGFTPDLLPGDAIGVCGPGTEGNAGHVQLFIKWRNDDPKDVWCTIVEMTPDAGPTEREIEYPIGTAYEGYRYVGMVDTPAPTPPIAPPPVATAAPLNPAEWPDGDFVTVVTYTDPDPAWNSTLSGIAEHTGTTVDALAGLNGIVNVDLIHPGQRIRVR